MLLVVIHHNLQQFLQFDQKIIDGFGVNGLAALVSKVATTARQIQTGYLPNYLTIMVLGIMVIVFWFLLA